MKFLLLSLCFTCIFAQTPAESYNSICPHRNGQVETLWPGYIVRYRCDVIGAHDTTAHRNVQTAQNCAQICRDTADCSGSSWASDTRRCLLSGPNSERPRANTVYMERVSDGGNEDPLGDDCEDERDECLREKDELEASLRQCTRERENLQSQLETCTGTPPSETGTWESSEGHSLTNHGYLGHHGGHTMASCRDLCVATERCDGVHLRRSDGRCSLAYRGGTAPLGYQPNAPFDAAILSR